MYLSLAQIAESFGVSEKVIEDWIRSEGLPHIPERGRLLFDRRQVADWAASRGLATHAGFLASTDPTLGAGWRLEPLLRQGGIWRDVVSSDIVATYGRVVARLPGITPAVRKLALQRIQAPGGVTLAPAGHGFALPHPSARIALGRDAGTLALLLLREPLPRPEPAVDDTPITRLFFFIAPSPRAHLDLLGKLSRALSHGPAREPVLQGASDEAIFAAVARADAAADAAQREARR